jgi:integrase
MLITAVESYLAVRRRAGFDLQRAEAVLRRFAQFAAAREETHVAGTTAIEWARLAPSPRARGRRLSIVTQFARHARAEDAQHEVPPALSFGHHPDRRVPYLFSPTDILRLLEATARLGPPGSLRPSTYRTLFGLLWSTGLRISEARALRTDDVSPDGLVIRETKFRKSRLVPLHDTVAVGVHRYLEQRLRVPQSDGHLFISLYRRKLGKHVVGHVFRMLVQHLDLRRGDHRPCLHDLRHSFAARALLSCPRDRGHVGRHLLALSTYMGHANVASTYWYLHSTPELLGDIASAVDAFMKGDGQ